MAEDFMEFEVSEEEYAILKEGADLEGLSVEDFVVKVLKEQLEEYEKTKED